ncbi:MAG: alkaline phosphatase family protein [Halanaerobiaceae bacterium]
MTAALTGSGPDKNGVSSRENKDLLVPDIFEKAEELGVESKYVEGNIKILNTAIEPVLNPDFNKNGTTDDEIFSTALEAVSGDSGFIFVHFHGIDDSGHDHGPLADKTLEVISKTDGYIRKLTADWTGKVIITADHGMHEADKGGDHGLVLYQDMFVPYIISDGGNIDE